MKIILYFYFSFFNLGFKEEDFLKKIFEEDFEEEDF